MLRITFTTAVLLAVAGGLVAGTTGQQVSALLLLVAVTLHRAVLARTHPAPHVGPVEPARAASPLGRLER